MFLNLISRVFCLKTEIHAHAHLFSLIHSQPQWVQVKLSFLLKGTPSKNVPLSGFFHASNNPWKHNLPYINVSRLWAEHIQDIKWALTPKSWSDKHLHLDIIWIRWLWQRYDCTHLQNNTHNTFLRGGSLDRINVLRFSGTTSTGRIPHRFLICFAI